MELYKLGTSEFTPESYKSALSIPIPIPTLSHSFRLVVDLDPIRPIGEGLHGGGEQFNWVNFTGGHFEGSFASGEVIPGGQDSQHILSESHPSAPLSAQLSTRYLLRTHETMRNPAYIQIQTRGWRTGPKEVLKKLATLSKGDSNDRVPGPEEYKFRLYIEIETDASDDKYAWLNQAMFVGSGMRSGHQVVYDAWLIG